MLVVFDNEQQLLEIKIIDLFVMLKKEVKKTLQSVIGSMKNGQHHYSTIL